MIRESAGARSASRARTGALQMPVMPRLRHRLLGPPGLSRPLRGQWSQNTPDRPGSSSRYVPVFISFLSSLAGWSYSRDSVLWGFAPRLSDAAAAPHAVDAHAHAVLAPHFGNDRCPQYRYPYGGNSGRDGGPVAKRRAAVEPARCPRRPDGARRRNPARHFRAKSAESRDRACLANARRTVAMIGPAA
jgi:hypothetical protein